MKKSTSSLRYLATSSMVALIVAGATSAQAMDFSVSTYAALNAAIANAGNGDTITLQNNISLTGDLNALTKK